MEKFLALKPRSALAIYLVLDTFCIGLGMGIPIFCILFGFPVGWYIVKNITTTARPIREVFRKVLWYALATASITLLGMAIIWGPTVSILFDPSRDIANFGIPLILYEPLASFIGWILLMVLVSPALQFLTTLFAAYLTLLPWLDKTIED